MKVVWLLPAVFFQVVRADSNDQADSSACLLPARTGKCRAAMRRYFFNATAGSCQQFIYGGCDGNDNRFRRLSDCQTTCDAESLACHLPVVVGKCQAYFNRFYFNSSTESCKEFVYGGCGGNGNNFRTKTECEMTCKPVCQLPVIAGDCNQEIPRYGWNTESGNCEYFIYTGCGGNRNKFQSQKDCLEMCGPPRVCQQDPSIGTCDEHLPRFFYNQTTKACEEFQYSGCEPNDNNFRSLYGCEAKCLATHSICHLEPEEGRCDGKIQRFYYDPNTKKCLNFFYGGCEGNENNFKELQDCEDECASKNKPVG